MHADFVHLPAMEASTMVKNLASLTIVTFNCQALFAAHPHSLGRTRATLAYVEKLARSNTVTLIQECHGAVGDIATLARLLPNRF